MADFRVMSSLILKRASASRPSGAWDNQWREERDEAIAPLKGEIADLKGRLDAVAELKGKVDALLTLLQGAKAEVIALPRKRPSDAA